MGPGWLGESVAPNGLNSMRVNLKALLHEWSTRETAILQPFFLISLLMVSMYLSFDLHLDLTHSTSMVGTVLIIALKHEVPK